MVHSHSLQLHSFTIPNPQSLIPNPVLHSPAAMLSSSIRAKVTRPARRSCATQSFPVNMHVRRALTGAIPEVRIELCL